jgi:hypothetical protein
VKRLESHTGKLEAERAKEGLISWAKMRRKRAVEALQSWRTGNRILELEAEIQVWSIGDLGAVFVPGEVFNEIGAEIRASSPFSSTFFVGYAKGNLGYIRLLSHILKAGMRSMTHVRSALERLA